MEPLFVSIFFILGIILGSFFNVVGLRLPQNIPFHSDRSYCPQCQQQLSWYELFPIISYIVQRGKCRHCQTHISLIYPFVEVMTGFLFMFCYITFGFEIELMTALFLVSMLMILFVSDIAYMLIPNKILLFFLPFLMIMRIISPLTPWYDSILGALSGFLLIAVIIIVSNGGMGAGDMKLFGVLGIVLGWKNTLIAFFIAIFLGSLIGSYLMLVNKVKRKEPIPFGPYIVFGALVSYFYGEYMITLYMSLF